MKLGFGLMRLPRLENYAIDIEQVKTMVDLFIAAGGTYFDTAFVYEGSEEATREALVKRYPREKYTLATKLNARAPRAPKTRGRNYSPAWSEPRRAISTTTCSMPSPASATTTSDTRNTACGTSFESRRPPGRSGTSVSPSTAPRSCWMSFCPPTRKWSLSSCKSTTPTGTTPAYNPGAAGRSRESTISQSPSWSPSRAAHWRIRPLS